MNSAHKKIAPTNVLTGIIIFLFVAFLIPSRTPAMPPDSEDYYVETYMGSVEKELCILLCNSLYSKLAIRPETVLRQMKKGLVIEPQISAVEIQYLGWEYDIREEKTMIDNALNKITALYRSQQGYSGLPRNFDTRALRFSDQETESLLDEISRQDGLSGF